MGIWTPGIQCISVKNLELPYQKFNNNNNNNCRILRVCLAHSLVMTFGGPAPRS